MLSKTENRSHIKILNKIASRIEPCGTSNRIYSCLFSFIFDKLLCISLDESTLNPHIFNFATMRRWSRLSNAFEESVKRAGNVLPLSVTFFHCSVMKIRQYWALNLCLKPQQQKNKKGKADVTIMLLELPSINYDSIFS